MAELPSSQPETRPAMLEQLFPGGDFEWAFRMRKADPVEFLTAQDDSGSLLEQKRLILAQHPDRHLFSTPVAPPLLGRLRDQLAGWGVIANETEAEPGAIATSAEPDLLLMEQSSLKLVAAAVCFPSSWNPADWPGATIDTIHAVVPRLNPQIGEMIRRFLVELKPGRAFQRANWSFTRSAELNYHPALGRALLDSDIRLEEIHLRLEHQLFTAIEGAVLMGIRIQPIPLLSLREDPVLWRNLIRALETMPEDVACYKNLHRGRQQLIDLVSEA